MNVFWDIFWDIFIENASYTTVEGIFAERPKFCLRLGKSLIYNVLAIITFYLRTICGFLPIDSWARNKPFASAPKIRRIQPTITVKNEDGAIGML